MPPHECPDFNADPELVVPIESVNDDSENICGGSVLYNASARSCGWCYGVLLAREKLSGEETFTACSNCPRLYCSPSCAQLDASTHSFWCGQAGEKGVDFEVKEITGKGMGLVTKRAFSRGERILAERPVFWEGGDSNKENLCLSLEASCKNNDNDNNKHVHTNIQAAAMALTPLEGTLQDKIHANRVSVAAGQPQAGLFLTFSRVNHDCIGNSDHYFDHEHGVQLLVANTDLEAGVEITFPYARTGKDRHQELEWRGFTCACRVCTCPNLSSKLNQLSDLEQVVNGLSSTKADALDKAVQAARSMLDLYDELRVSDRDYARVHYDLFQMLVVQPCTLAEAKGHIAKAHQHALTFCGYEGHEIVKEFLQYSNHPEKHFNYLSSK